MHQPIDDQTQAWSYAVIELTDGDIRAHSLVDPCHRGVLAKLLAAWAEVLAEDEGDMH